MKLQRVYFRIHVSGFTLIELSIVLFIIGVLITIGIGFWKGAYKFIKFKQYLQKFEQKKELLLSASNSPEHLTEVYKRDVKNSFPKSVLIFSQAYLRTFPNPCYFSEELSPIEDAPFLKFKLFRGKKIKEFLIPFFYVETGLNNKFEFKYDGENTIVIKDTPQVDDKYLAPSMEFLRSYHKCGFLPQYVIDSVTPENRVLDKKTVVYRVVYPSECDLMVSSPVEIKKFKEHKKEVELGLKEGINLVEFVLLKEGKEIYRRRDYIGVIGKENPDCSIENFEVLPESNSTEELSAPLRTKFKWDFPCAKKYKCLIDFGDGEYAYFPECENVSIAHTYLYKGIFKPVLFIDDGNFTYTKETELEIDEGNDIPKVLFYAELEKIGKKNKVNEQLKLSIKVEDEESCICKVYYKSKRFLKNKNCDKINLKLIEKSFKFVPIKIVIEDRFGAKKIISAYGDELPWLMGDLN